MPVASPAPPAVVLRLDGPALHHLLGPDGPGAAALGSALDASGADAVLLGADRLGPDRPSGPALDTTVVATLLAVHTDRIGLVPAAAPQRDHPYNLARRIASLDHVSGGRAGWLVGDHDVRAPGPSPWTPHGPGPATTADAVLAVRRLWRSWPVASVVADRDSGVFAHADRIRHVEHRGAFDVDGPLNVPEGPQGEPPVLWWGVGPAPADVCDAVVVPDGHPHPPAGLPALSAAPGRHGIVVTLSGLPPAGLAARHRPPGPPDARMALGHRAPAEVTGRPFAATAAPGARR